MRCATRIAAPAETMMRNEAKVLKTVDYYDACARGQGG
jgi:hypothetical protein